MLLSNIVDLEDRSGCPTSILVLLISLLLGDSEVVPGFSFLKNTYCLSIVTDDAVVVLGFHHDYFQFDSDFLMSWIFYDHTHSLVVFSCG